MAGRSERRVRAAVLGLILWTGATAPVFAQTVRGESHGLGIKFQVAGGSSWCAPRIRVALTAEKSEALQPDSVQFLQMIGRIRAVVLSQCPQIETIAFEGSHRGSTTLIAEMSRLTEWRRFITFDSASQQPSCPPAVPPARCRKQAEAFVVADHLFRGNRFADTEIVNMLEPEANDLGFRSNGVVGKLRIVAHDDFVGQFSTPKQLADAIADDIANACVNDGGRPDPPGRLDLGPTLIRRFVICRASGRPDGQNVVLVWDSKDRFRVFSLLAEGAHAGEASAFAGNLIRAIQAKP